MLLFKVIARSSAVPRHQSETTFNFLDRVAGDFWDDVRTLFEDWLARVPDTARGDLLGRLRASDRHFAAAFWELYLHEGFLRGGCEVEVHPKVLGPRPPDFLVTREDETFYVEAKAIFEAEKGSGAEARREILFESLNRLHSPNFFLSIECVSVGARPVASGSLRRELEAWLDSLDPEVETELLTRGRGARFSWKRDGWVLKFRPIPLGVDQRGKFDHRPVGSTGSGGARLVDDSGVLRKALGRKGAAYGQLDHPLMLAVSVERPLHDDDDSADALFGSTQITIDRRAPGSARSTRAPDGYWLGPSGWRHTEVPAVLIAQNIAPWLVTKIAPTLWLHPEGKPIQPLGLWRTAAVVIDQIEYTPGRISPSDHFDLSGMWPTGDPFPKRGRSTSR